jgi:hypothetical protein
VCTNSEFTLAQRWTLSCACSTGRRWRVRMLGAIGSNADGTVGYAELFMSGSMPKPCMAL